MIMKFKGFKASLRQQKNIILFKMPRKIISSENIKMKYKHWLDQYSEHLTRKLNCSNSNIKHHHTTVQTILLKVNSLQRVTKFMLICIYIFFLNFTLLPDYTCIIWQYFLISIQTVVLTTALHVKSITVRLSRPLKFTLDKSYYIIQICSQFTASKNKLYRKTIYLYNNTMISVIVKDYKVA